MIVCLDLPDETNMLSITMSTPASTAQEVGAVTTQALFDPREVKDYKLDYLYIGGKPVVGCHYYNGVLVNKRQI